MLVVGECHKTTESHKTTERSNRSSCSNQGQNQPTNQKNKPPCPSSGTGSDSPTRSPNEVRSFNIINAPECNRVQEKEEEVQSGRANRRCKLGPALHNCGDVYGVKKQLNRKGLDRATTTTL